MTDPRRTPETRTCPMCGEMVAIRATSCGACGEDLAGARPQDIDPGDGQSAVKLEIYPAISTDGAFLPRYLAASLDSVIALIVAAAAAKSIDGDVPLIQVPLFVGVFLGYYLLSEGATGRTPAKWFTGLVVVQFDGSRSTWRQAVVRTLYRLLEVNPFLLGGLPAAIAVLRSPFRQRFGDRRAGTVVVLSRRVKRRQAK